MTRALFLVTPHPGGTFSVYLNLRTALRKLEGGGIDLQWLGYTEHPEEFQPGGAMAEHLASGQLVDARGLDQQALGQRLLTSAVALAPEVLFINVLTSPAEMSLAAYLPPAMRRVMVVHSITPGTFAGARAAAPFVHAVVGVSPRIHEGLIQSLDVPRERIFCVPNALDLTPFLGLSRQPMRTPCKVLFLGRITDTDKGVFWLPKIVAQFTPGQETLTIAGDGRDLPELKRRCRGLEDRITFLGRVPAAAVPGLVASHDVFLMTSRFEGLPYSLVEAMSGGCVPVASRIRGVTDYVVKDGQTGLLFDTGNVQAAAQAVRRLAADPVLHEDLSKAAAADMVKRFSTDAFATAYKPVLDYVRSAAPTASRHGEPFALLPFGGGWRRLVPEFAKNVLRRYMYR